MRRRKGLGNIIFLMIKRAGPMDSPPLDPPEESFNTTTQSVPSEHESRAKRPFAFQHPELQLVLLNSQTFAPNKRNQFRTSGDSNQGKFSTLQQISWLCHTKQFSIFQPTFRFGRVQIRRYQLQWLFHTCCRLRVFHPNLISYSLQFPS